MGEIGETDNGRVFMLMVIDLPMNYPTLTLPDALGRGPEEQLIVGSLTINVKNPSPLGS